MNSKSNSIYNKSKSRSISNKKNNSKKNIFDINNSILFARKKKIRNANNKNIKQFSNKDIINKFNWRVDSRNKKCLFTSKNSFKCNTKNIFCQNDSSFKASFIDAVNYIKNSNKNKDLQKYTKIFKYLNYNKNCCLKTQRNYSFNNI